MPIFSKLKLLSSKNKSDILKKFDILSKRTIQDYTTEYKNNDRIEFDKEILKAFGINTSILPQLYEVLISTINNRVEMKNR